MSRYLLCFLYFSFLPSTLVFFPPSFPSLSLSARFFLISLTSLLVFFSYSGFLSLCLTSSVLLFRILFLCLLSSSPPLSLVLYLSIFLYLQFYFFMTPVSSCSLSFSSLTPSILFLFHFYISYLPYRPFVFFLFASFSRVYFLLSFLMFSV